MGIIVQKYGGSSVADIEKLKNVCEHITKEYDKGNKVVVVVSAQGKMTDQLIKEEMEITKKPSKREHDVLLSVGEQISIAKLCICLKERGYDSVSLTGWQIPIITDSNHSEAKIKYINKDRILKYLNNKEIVVVAGFQGIDEKNDITTLGRGGSDTTAVAIASILNAERCDIYTDVDGVFSSDPRKISKVKKIESISYDEMLELSSMGAKVLHNRCVEIGKKYNIPINVKSTFINNSIGTNVTNKENIEKTSISGISSIDGITKIEVTQKKGADGGLYKIINLLKTNNIKFDMVSQIIKENTFNHISFCINTIDCKKVSNILNINYKKLKLKKIKFLRNLSKISIVGIGIFNDSEVIFKLLKSLHENNINLYMITTSEIKISILVDNDQSDYAARCLHKELIANT